ncbi:hypothetical protein ACQCVE_18970 [Metabacillus sp. 113a]|uniref:hypothetical protein n=1 Tax=Metabacillus sp. 113a TaxID=3404706 RepID=UPI003CF5BE60
MPIFIEGLKDRFYCSKHHAVIGVCKFDDGNYTDLVYKFVSKLTSYSRILEADETKPTDLIAGLSYLDRYIGDKGKMVKLLERITRVERDVFSETEKKFIEKYIENGHRVDQNKNPFNRNSQGTLLR